MMNRDVQNSAQQNITKQQYMKEVHDWVKFILSYKGSLISANQLMWYPH